jgi:pyruvate formate lyase activating enzyme
MLTRRDFLKVAALAPFALQAQATEVPRGDGTSFREALYYKPAGDGKGTVSCQLCPRACVLAPGESGFCRARKNIKGRLYSLGYASPCAVHVDPVEKKPFFHVLPKTLSFSIASAGCNLRCKFCQNWQISQVSPTETDNMNLPPERIVALARERSCTSIAYTYTEPTNFFEYMLDTAKLARQKGIINVSHSNGYISEEPLKALSKYLDAVNIDLKGFSSSFYNRLCEADLDPVLATLKVLKAAGVWVEITNLVIPGHNDDAKMVTDMCQWVAKNLGRDVPIHFSRFYPMYKLTSIQPTPVATLERARDIALKAGIRFAYLGNVPGNAGEHTYCPSCGKVIIKRSGYNILEIQMKGSTCRYCGGKVAGIWA